MKREIRTVVYDEDLQIEAYRFEGFVRPFPGHFHEYYVIGYIESGQRTLTCKNQEYAVRPGHILIFNPGDSHACVQSDDGTLDYRGFNISRDVMLSLLGELDDKQAPPVFSQNVIFDSETASCLRTLHDLVLSGSREGDKRRICCCSRRCWFRSTGSLSPAVSPGTVRKSSGCAGLSSRITRNISVWISFAAVPD